MKRHTTNQVEDYPEHEADYNGNGGEGGQAERGLSIWFNATKSCSDRYYRNVPGH